MAKKKKKPADDDLPKKKKGKKKVDDDDDLDEVEDVDLADEDDDDDRPSKKSDGPKDDAYTGLLAIAMIAFIAVAVLWYMDHEHHASQTISNPRVNIPGLGAFSQSDAGGGGMPTAGN